MAVTYPEHEQTHARPGLTYFLMAMVFAFPVVLAILAYVFSYKGSSV